MNTNENPWLRIPLADYEGHMEAVGQSRALRRAFTDVYAARQPARLAVLGCTSGADFDAVDPDVTKTIVGVDLNPAYLAAAERRTATLRTRTHLVCGDVLQVELARAPFDLVHAALLVEYVDPATLFRRVRQWLDPQGAFSLVIQEPLADAPAVSRTSYVSLRALSEVMSLRTADDLAGIAAREGLASSSRRTFELANGKALAQSVFVISR